MGVDDTSDFLHISGRACILHDDIEISKFINSMSSFSPWFGDTSVTIERYDGRHLLENIEKSVIAANSHEFQEDVDESEIDEERYRFLGDENSGVEFSQEVGTEKSSGRRHAAIPFNYNTILDRIDAENKSSSQKLPSVERTGEEQHDKFVPPFPLPDSLKTCVPPSDKLHQIIARTAKFVAEHGGQSEFVLRVKQEGNPLFRFLIPDNELHPYFRYLVTNPTLAEKQKLQQPDSERKHESEENAIALLGATYSDDDDEEDSDNAPVAKQGNVEVDERMAAPLDPGVRKQSSEPPEDVKKAILTLVAFIARNGRQFELVVREKDKYGSKFPFLNARNQWHAYYQQQLDTVLSVNGDSVEGNRKTKMRLQLPHSKQMTESESDCSKAREEIRHFSHERSRGKPSLSLSGNESSELNEQFQGSNHWQSGRDSQSALRSTADVASLLSRAIQKGAEAEWEQKGHEEIVLAAKIASKTVQESVTGSGKSVDENLSMAEKKKAERLQKAKIFASIIKGEKNVVHLSSSGLSGGKEHGKDFSENGKTLLTGGVGKVDLPLPSAMEVLREEEIVFKLNEEVGNVQKQSMCLETVSPFRVMAAKKIRAKNRNLRRKTMDVEESEEEAEGTQKRAVEEGGMASEEGGEKEGSKDAAAAAAGDSHGSHVIGGQDMNHKRERQHFGSERSRFVDEDDRWQPELSGDGMEPHLSSKRNRK